LTARLMPRIDLGAAPNAITAVRDLAFESLVEQCALAESFARSAAEASWRGDELTVGVHLRQLRLTVIEAIKTFRALGGQSGDQ
jgi:hypothetical protein